RVGSGPFPTEQINETGEKLRKLGHEFGATTGRPRRTGWLDLPTLKYSIMLNGVTDLICTKSDVLSGFDDVLVCNQYHIDGQTTSELPFNLNDIQVNPIYQTFNGWSEDLTKIRKYADLPDTFKNYMDFVEKEIGVGVGVISVGPDREETIIR
ncbi:MAG: adenylosuccinate synthetase, partial [Bacteroidetes bacterium]|nr:adenylosuccinate synthetase [Bacteroidota bacterium]